MPKRQVAPIPSTCWGSYLGHELSADYRNSVSFQRELSRGMRREKETQDGLGRGRQKFQGQTLSDA